MNKTTLIKVLLTLNVMVLGAQDAFRGFEGSAQDNWNYTSNIPFYNQNSDTDLWTDYSQANGRITKAFAGSTYLAGRDLDNSYTEAVTGEASPEHILTFDPFAINGLSAEFTFRLYYVFLDKNDYIYYELSYDNGTSWSSPDEHVDVFSTSLGGKFSLSGWDEIRFDVPAGNEFVRLRLVIYQNGNGYIGLDNFELKTVTLSTSNNLIEGFTFGPNPTEGILKLKAKVILDKATMYDVLGKEIYILKGDSTEMELNISHLPNGVYFTKVESNGIIQTIRVIKK
ncbi:MAG: T9SS type A sorting domain-containing protein [Flavobacteriaceae bacterium]|nr:T9SS type A sorting domain-containing protein [Flavobacteriaceae bacterium]